MTTTQAVKLEPRNRAQAITHAEEVRSGQDEASYARLFHRYLLHGPRGLNAEELRLLNRSVNKPSWAQVDLRAQSIGTPTAGGYLVPQSFMDQMEEALKHYSAVRSVCRVETTPDGRSMHWPTVNDTTQVGELLAENAVATEQDVVFSEVVFSSFRYSS